MSEPKSIVRWNNNRGWSVRWRGREVTNQPWRGMATVALFAVAIASAAIGLLGMAFGVLIVIPLALVLHGPLRLLGFRGTVEHTETRFSVKLNRRSFTRRSNRSA